MRQIVPEFKGYMDSLRRMGIAPGTERRILLELYQHLEEEVRELEISGMPREEAVRRAVALCGPPREIARDMADIYARSSPGQALLGAAPHALIAVTFLFHLWQRPSWIVFLATLTGGLALYGWARGKPAWFYPWLGYSLAAAIAVLFIAGLLAGWSALRNFGVEATEGWRWALVGAYAPLALALLALVARQVARQDWLYASAMFLPLPVLAGWALRLHQQGRLLEQGQYRLQDMDAGVAAIFIVLAVTVAAFLRVRQRALKISLLLLTAVGVWTVVAISRGVSSGPFGFVLIALALVVFFISPALIDRWSGPEAEPWASPLAEQPSIGGWHRPG